MLICVYAYHTFSLRFKKIASIRLVALWSKHSYSKRVYRASVLLTIFMEKIPYAPSAYLGQPKRVYGEAAPRNQTVGLYVCFQLAVYWTLTILRMRLYIFIFMPNSNFGMCRDGIMNLGHIQVWESNVI